MVELTDKSEVNEENQIPIPEDKLKEEQKKEFEELVEKFRRECLKSYIINRSGEVIKKFDLPTFQSLTEAQHENKMMDAVGQAVAQAFIKSATVMGNTVHNAVVKTFAEGTFSGCMGPCYIQPDQMQYTPLEVSMAAALSAQDSQAGTSNSQTPPQMTTAASLGYSRSYLLNHTADCYNCARVESCYWVWYASGFLFYATQDTV